MRITVESAGFTQAADACRATNEIAAMTTQTLAGKLGHYAGMAGNDSTSTTFAESYDDAAREALATLTELTHAFIGLGRLIQTTGDNHRAAEEATAGREVTQSRHDTTGWTRVSPATPPSSLGGQEPSLGTIDQWILDHVEGFVWPGADTALLRDAAATWRSAAHSIAHLEHHLDDIITLLSRQHSPEIPLALDVLDTVRTLITDTSTHLSDLAQSCDDYATAVEETHNRTKALLAEIGQMVIEGAVISGLVAAFTGPLGGSAAIGAVISRITANSHRFRALQATLHIAATTASTRARTARDGLRAIRTKAEKLARIPARTERGSMKNPLGWGGGVRQPGWLKRHEVPPGHTLERHVGKSADELLERAAARGKPASSFTDAAAAEKLVDRVLASEKSTISAWLRSGSDEKLVLNVSPGETTGISVFPDGTTVEQTAIRVIIIPNSKLDEGWQILTAFPN